MAKKSTKPARPTRPGQPDREVVQSLLDSGAVNFEAIGAAVAKFGPSLALNASDEWESFCLTMKIFVRLYRFPFPTFERQRGLEDLGALREGVASDVRG
jgi:hypothetical protein